MPQGNYDHPAYLARHMVSGITVAGASGTSGHMSFPVAVRLRNAAATVRVAGTSAAGGNSVNFFVGTGSVGTIALGTGALGANGTAGDMNTLIPVGTVLAFKNGTDATGVAFVECELHIDPTTGTWS